MPSVQQDLFFATSERCRVGEIFEEVTYKDNKKDNRYRETIGLDKICAEVTKEIPTLFKNC